jgi:hypothetical protein
VRVGKDDFEDLLKNLYKVYYLSNLEEYTHNTFQTKTSYVSFFIVYTKMAKSDLALIKIEIKTEFDSGGLSGISCSQHKNCFAAHWIATSDYRLG